MKIKMKNFQAFRSEELEFSPGLTLITGPTNNGKTSVFRALKSLLLNPSEAVRYINGDAIKEQGENAELVVTLIDDDIPKIEFHRTQAKAWYVIDGKKFSKLNRSNIFDLYPDLHRKFVYDPADSRKILNFQTETELEFPFDKSDTEMFKLFERIFNISDTRSIIDTIKREKDETKFKMEMNLGEKEKLTSEIGNLKKITGSVSRELLTNYVLQYQQAQAKAMAVGNQLQKILNYAPYLQIAAELPTLKSKTEDSSVRVKELQKKIQECEAKMNYIKNFAETSFSPNSDDLDAKVEELWDKNQKILQINCYIALQEQFLEKSQKQIEEAKTIIDSYDVCPLCGQELREKLHA